MVIDAARDHARRESATRIHLHHVLLAYADRRDSPAGRILHECGWRDAHQEAGDGEAPHRYAPELTLHLAWVNGLRTALPSGFDSGVALLLSCVLGPTASLHRWLQNRGVDLDALCASAATALGLPESIGERREHWSPDPIVVSADEVDGITQDLRRRGLRYQINIRADGSAVIIPEEAR